MPRVGDFISAFVDLHKDLCSELEKDNHKVKQEKVEGEKATAKKGLPSAHEITAGFQLWKKP